MLVKANRNVAYEAHLQAYFLQNCDTSPLREITYQKVKLPLWIGNEVSCGVGMQSIDVLLCQEDDDTFYISIIELKCIKPYESIITYQMPWYIYWIKDYIAPLYAKNVIITPIILAPKIRNSKVIASYIEKCNRFKFNSTTSGNLKVNSINYIGYTTATDIIFETIK